MGKAHTRDAPGLRSHHFMDADAQVGDSPGSTCRRSKVEEQGEGEVKCKCLWLSGSHGRARSPTIPGSLEVCLDVLRAHPLLLLLLALGQVDLEGLVPLDDRAPLEAHEDHAAPNEQPHNEAPDCDAGDSAVVQVTTFDV